MFIATHTKIGKKLQADTQIAMAGLQNRQNSRETADNAFTTLFCKEKPGLLRCYSRSVTASSSKKDEKHSKCVVSNIASPIDVGSAQDVKGQNPLKSYGSTHDPIVQKGPSNDVTSVLK
ncbi:hypothetical protein EJD97_013324 [Solanum chilense]|uniref:Uncharacterized protein n=1 Tax=Solanum chilense TaxID=4083 RepID=A0A6N2BEL3_SOLCI|nr:hypothetical protein EJD97_013324 [Solanum chilense]